MCQFELKKSNANTYKYYKYDVWMCVRTFVYTKKETKSQIEQNHSDECNHDYVGGSMIYV